MAKRLPITLAEARARCHALGITPGRSVAACMERIKDAEVRRGHVLTLDDVAQDRAAALQRHRAHRVARRLGTMTGLSIVLARAPLAYCGMDAAEATLWRRLHERAAVRQGIGEFFSRHVVMATTTIASVR